MRLAHWFGERHFFALCLHGHACLVRLLVSVAEEVIVLTRQVVIIRQRLGQLGGELGLGNRGRDRPGPAYRLRPNFARSAVGFFLLGGGFALHDESLSETLTVKRLLLQFQLESANVLVTLVVSVLIFLIL